MSRARLFGAILCLFALAATVVLLWGLVIQAYWAIAIPAGFLVVVVMTVVLWIGWTFMLTETGPEQPPAIRQQRPPPRLRE